MDDIKITAHIEPNRPDACRLSVDRELYAGTAQHLYGRSHVVNPAVVSYTLREPVGVVGAIIPEDYADDWVVLDQLPKPSTYTKVGSKVDLMLGDPLEPCPPG